MESRPSHENSNEMWARYHAAGRGSVQGLLHVLKQNLVCKVFARRVLSFAGEEPVSSILELGCGSGSTLKQLQRLSGATCYGVDRCEPVIEAAKRSSPGLHLEVKDLFALDYPDKAYDLVYSIGLLEHFQHEDQLRLLALHARLARRSIALMTPADSLLMNSILWVNRDLRGRTGTWADEEVFSRQSLARKFPQYRFESFKDALFGNLILWFGCRV
jgi:cyclopropane fatty-acyl-phospholipid synthase-like methyltransferase